MANIYLSYQDLLRYFALEMDSNYTLRNNFISALEHSILHSTPDTKIEILLSEPDKLKYALNYAVNDVLIKMKYGNIYGW